MKWKDSNDTVGPEAQAGDEARGAKPFSIRNGNGPYLAGQSYLPGKKIPAILVGGGVLVLVLLLIWLIFGSGKSSNVEHLNALESRVKILEERVASLEPVVKKVNAAAEQGKTIGELSQRIDGLESIMTKEIDRLSRQQAAPKPQKAAAAAAVKAPPPKTAAGPDKGQQATYHVVQAGENLYRISLRYNLKMDELLRLNNLKPGAAIHTGQRLLVSPQKTQ